MSIAIVTLVNVSSPSETIFIKELTLNILPNEEVFITEQFQYQQVNSAFAVSILDAVNNDKVLVKIDGVLQSKVDSIAYLTAPSIPGGSGEANTASNLGAGEGVFAQKTGVDLEFKSLVAGTNITLTGSADEITIDASGGATVEQFYLERTETIDNATAVDIEYFTFVQGGTEISNIVSATGGDYWFELSYICFNTSTSGRVVVNPQINSTNVFSQEFKKQPISSSEIFYGHISKQVTLSAGNNTIEIQLSNDGSGTARIFEANVQITKV